MTRTLVALLAFTALVMSGCLPEAPVLDEPRIMSRDRLYQDPRGDAPLSDVDITSARIVAEDSQMVITLSVAELADSLPYALSETPSGSLEYEWSVNLDMDGDASLSPGDLIIGLFKFKSPIDTMPAFGDPVAFTQKSVFRITKEGTRKHVVKFNATRSGSALSLRLGREVLDSLNIQDFSGLNVPARFHASRLTSTGRVEDFHPESGYAR